MHRVLWEELISPPSCFTETIERLSFSLRHFKPISFIFLHSSCSDRLIFFVLTFVRTFVFFSSLHFLLCHQILRLIDPTNISLEHINKPIHAYLRTRPDAINCIVSSLVEKEDSVLYQELSRSATARSLVRLSASAIRGDLEFDFDMSRDVVWRPRPRVPDTSLPFSSTFFV